MKEPASILRTAFVSTSLQSRLRFITCGVWGNISRGFSCRRQYSGHRGRNRCAKGVSRGGLMRRRGNRWMGAQRQRVFPPSLRRLARQDLQRFRSGHSPPWSRPSSDGPRRRRLAPPALLSRRGASSFKSSLNPSNFCVLGTRPVRWHDNFDAPRLRRIRGCAGGFPVSGGISAAVVVGDYWMTPGAAAARPLALQEQAGVWSPQQTPNYTESTLKEELQAASTFYAPFTGLPPPADHNTTPKHPFFSSSCPGGQLRTKTA
jgi:hypothetical protein